MKKNFFGERITQLRMGKGMSECKLSGELGQSSSYINTIANGKSLPSMKAFLAICEYFELTPVEFFLPSLNKKTEWLFNSIQDLSAEDIDTLQYIVKAMIAKNKLAQTEEGHDRKR